MTDVQTALVMADAAGQVDPTQPLADRFRAAFRAAANHWMVLDEDRQFNGAVAAVHEKATDEERARIEAELEAIKYLNAMLSGVRVDVDAIPNLSGEPLHLLDLWREAKER